MIWNARKSVLGYWGVEWRIGDRWVAFTPSQYGRVIAASIGGFSHTPLVWSEIHKAADLARQDLAASGIRRHGWRGSAERRQLCDLIADYLNAAGVVPKVSEGSA